MADFLPCLCFQIREWLVLPCLNTLALPRPTCPNTETGTQGRGHQCGTRVLRMSEQDFSTLPWHCRWGKWVRERPNSCPRACILRALARAELWVWYEPSLSAQCSSPASCCYLKGECFPDQWGASPAPLICSSGFKVCARVWQVGTGIVEICARALGSEFGGHWSKECSPSGPPCVLCPVSVRVSDHMVVIPETPGLFTQKYLCCCTNPSSSHLVVGSWLLPPCLGWRYPESREKTETLLHRPSSPSPSSPSVWNCRRGLASQGPLPRTLMEPAVGWTLTAGAGSKAVPS